MTEEHPVLVDSNVFIDALRRGDDPLVELLDRYPLTDLVIAACAIHEGASILTSDRHFDLVPGLQIVRP